MAIPYDEWLPQAMRLPVGRTVRVLHRREGRPNLVIKHLEDRYTAYCHSCHEGAVKMKEHVRLTGARAPACSSDLSLPQDKAKLSALSMHLRDAVLRHIASKNMDCVYLPELWFSDSRKRLLIQTEQGWMGRDVTGASPQKWITYNRQTFLQHHGKVQTLAIVVEDTFSYYKVRWAMRHCPNVGVFCALGTTLSNGLLLELWKYESVLMFLDGDKAGWQGANDGAQRVRAYGKKARVACAPLDKDPKDMTIQEITEHVWNGTNVTQSMT